MASVSAERHHEHRRSCAPTGSSRTRPTSAVARSTRSATGRCRTRRADRDRDAAVEHAHRRCPGACARARPARRGSSADQPEQHLPRHVLARPCRSCRRRGGRCCTRRTNVSDREHERAVGVAVDELPERRGDAARSADALHNTASRMPSANQSVIAGSQRALTAFGAARRDHTDVPRRARTRRAAPRRRSRSRPGASTGGRRVSAPSTHAYTRQRRVERQLDRERPRGHDAREAVVRVGRSARAGSGARSPRTRAARSCRSSRIAAVSATQYAGKMRSARRHQNAPQRDRVRGRARCAATNGRYSRNAGDHEEDRDAHVETGEVAAEAGRGDRARGRRDVQPDDRERGDRAQPVEARRSRSIVAGVAAAACSRRAPWRVGVRPPNSGRSLRRSSGRSTRYQLSDATTIVIASAGITCCEERPVGQRLSAQPPHWCTFSMKAWCQR